MEIIKEKTCCFFGHRKIEDTKELRECLIFEIERLIEKENVDTFLFGSKSEFDKLCLLLVSEIKQKYPHIKRVYVRAEYPYIDESYTAYLLESYEHTYYPERILNAGRAVYVERNREMIDKSAFSIVFFDDSYLPSKSKVSGTKLAYDYAISKKNKMINVFC